MVLQKGKPESNGFSLMQMLSGNSSEIQGGNFSQILKELGMDAHAMSGMKQREGVIDFSTLLQGGSAAALSSPEQTVLAEVDKDILVLLESFNREPLDAEDAWSMINPKLLQHYSDDDVKQMMAEAKTYLKLQIGDLAKAQGITLDVERLPKTLQSLTVIAEKIGIDLSHMTLETLQKKLPNIAVNDKQLAILAPQQKSAEYSTQALVRFKSDHKASDSEQKPVRIHDITTKQEPLKTLLQVPVQKAQESPRHSVVRAVTQESGSPTVAPALASSSLSSQHTGVLNIATLPSDDVPEQGRPTERVAPLADTLSDDTGILRKLHTLLGSDEVRSAASDDGKHENKLASIVPTEGKSNTLELKIHEAKQMVSHVAGSLKEAVENYKPPFTRITMQLHPAKLGEVDVTMIQRGNNVHINISSNNSAIAVLAQHSVELKNQLANSGLGSATMQFNTGGGEQQRQSQHQQNIMEAYEKYGASEGEERYETLSSLELIVPRYV